jgi:FtsP/CotA-like multicopper oxidase with cupredoxin domain
MAAENFMDTAVINGTAYPFLEVDPATYRFRILNAADDRFFNLQLVEATSIIESITVTNGGSGYTRAPSVRIVDFLADGVTPGPGIGAKALANLEYDPVTGQPTGRIASIDLLAVGSGYVNPQITLVGGLGVGGTAATATAKVYGLAPGEDTEVGMVEFSEFQADGSQWPAGWPTPDARMGGIPDANKLGPQMIQIGTEGGFLPTPVVLDNIPLGWQLDPGMITVNNVKEHNLFLGCAERADVIVDFSQFAGKTLILYTDSPAPVPAGDPRVDYYTGNPDQTAEGGAPSTLPGYGSNVRTLMQIRVRAVAPAAPFDLTNLINEFATTAADATGGGATATATVAAGAVTAVDVVDGGLNYTVAPIVTIDPPPAGVTATATAHIAGGVVTGITVTNPGSGYAAAPLVTLAPAPAKVGVFARGQEPIIVPQDIYNEAYGANFPGLTTAYERINSNSLTFQPLDLTTPAVGDLANQAVTINNNDKAIIEEWATDWGRIRTFLGVEVPFTNSTNQTSLWFTVEDPVTEILADTGDVGTLLHSAPDGTQFWKIAHNGVDTHAIHFHLFNVQIINRVDWAGFVFPPEPNERGWKDTVRMNPLETCIVALRPKSPKLEFGQPDSIRLLDPTQPLGGTMGFKPFDANGNPVTIVNDYYNFGWEYVWHCHLLSHEEMDMMRPMQFNAARALAGAPFLNAVLNGAQVELTWTDATPVGDPATLGNPANEVGFRIERAVTGPGGVPGVYIPLGTAPANSTTFVDTTLNPLVGYTYRVVAFNAAGETLSNESALPTENFPPTANAGGPYSDDIGKTIVVSAAASTDPNQDIVSYEWDFNNDGLFTDATGVTANYLAATKGRFTIGVRVTDSAGFAGTATTTVTVDNDTIGVYNPADASFHLRNHNDPGPADWLFTFGTPGFVPLGGDWNGDGIDTVGAFRLSTRTFFLRNFNTSGAANVSYTWGYTGPAWQPIVGDWNGDGITTTGLYDPASGTFYLKNKNSGSNATNPTTTFKYSWANPGWQAIAGDWDGNGTDTIGLYDPTNAVFYLRNSNSGGNPNVTFAYGMPGTGWLPVAGDWDANGTDTVGMYNAAAGEFYLRNSNTGGVADESFGYGPVGAAWKPVIGDWDTVAPLLAAGGEVAGAQGVAALTRADLQPIISQAIADWASAGVAVDLLNALDFAIADLPGAQVGLAGSGRILLDLDAAGHGWFVDPTPAANEEFRQAGNRLTAVGAEAVDRIDLLTVVSHEIGHTLGLGDLDASLDSLMSGALGSGVRREPGLSEIDAVFGRL